MDIDYANLLYLRQHHPAWRLLRSDHAPMIIGFLHRVFVLPNVRVIEQGALVEALEDDLYALREQHGEEAFPRSAQAYLNDWTEADKGWLRKFYRHDSDEPYFDLMPATEKAITWIVGLGERSFVGTESRLLTLFELLRQMSEGSETDPQTRITELQRRRETIDAEIARVLDGDLPLLDETALKERFQQFMQLARELLADFREVEHNFRRLDRRVREQIALWEGARGALLEEVMGERDAIADSDQGRSFRAFWDFLMSSRHQQELSERLERILQLPALGELAGDPRLRRIHYDWLEAGEHTQRTVALLSQQLRRFLDDRAWLENRRIMEILHNLEARALALREQPPDNELMTVESTAAAIELSMERPLHTTAPRPRLDRITVEAGDEAIDAAALYAQIVVDKGRLAAHVRHALQGRSQITLRELCGDHPLQHGLAELVAYLSLPDDTFRTTIDETTVEQIAWQGSDANGEAITRRAELPRIIFVR